MAVRRRKKSPKMFRKVGRSVSRSALSAVGGPANPYVAAVDSKNRVTIRGAAAKMFKVTPRKDGSLLLKPAIVFEDGPISARTLRCIEKSIANMRAGKRSAPADLKKYARFAK